jgi:hypothetical protein
MKLREIWYILNRETKQLEISRELRKEFDFQPIRGLALIQSKMFIAIQTSYYSSQILKLFLLIVFFK